MRRRILFSMVTVTAVAVVALTIPLGILTGRIYRGRQVSRLERVALRVVGAGPTFDPTQPIQLPVGPPNVIEALYDTNGRLVAGVGPTKAPTEVLTALQGRITNDRDGRALSVAIPVQRDGRVVGAARASTSWHVVANDTSETWYAFSAFALIAVAVAAALASWQSTRLVAPVDDLAYLAVRLGEGDFSARVEPSRIAELDAAGQALNRTAARLGALVDRERAFTADVSHQLNTPLTSLRLKLEAAQLAPDDAASTVLDEALEEVERLQRTVTTLLTVARDTRNHNSEPADVAAVCRDVAARFTPVLALDKRALILRDELPVAPVRCPAEVLGEILTVLVDNAVHHGEGTVTIAARPSGPGVVVDVSDEGPGITTAPSTLFERRSPDAAGHGIGLALARSLAEAHDARLHVTRAGPKPVFSVALAAVDRDADGPTA